MALKWLIVSILIGGFVPSLHALEYKVVNIANEGGEPYTIGKIKILSVFRLLATSVDGQPMVELSALAWSEDENTLYALSDHGAIFHFKPEFEQQRLVDLDLHHAYPLQDADKNNLAFPWSDSEGLSLKNSDNGQAGDDELLVSYELKPRLQWHRADGRFIKNEPLPTWLEDKSSYYRRYHALEAVAIHPTYGVLTVPELPMEEADWQLLTLYTSDGGELRTARDAEDEMSVCAIEVMPDGDLLVLKRRHRLWGPVWVTQLERLRIRKDQTIDRAVLATMKAGESGMPIDNFEGLTHHRENRYFMISDDNEHFAQHTLLVYFEVLP